MQNEDKSLLMGLSNSIKRKVGIKNKTLTISIPKEWANFYGIKAKSKVKIVLNHKTKAFMVYFDPEVVNSND